MVSSLDGRIDGDFFGLPGMAPAWRANREIRAKYGCTAVINGTTTAAQIWADGLLDPKTLPQSGEKWARFDLAADRFKEAGVRLSTLSNYGSLIDEATSAGVVKASDAEVLQSWRLDPANWGND